MKITFVQAVKKHALENYEKEGWDTVIECWTDAEIAEVIKHCRTEAGAIRKMNEELSHFAAYRSDIEGTAF